MKKIIIFLFSVILTMNCVNAHIESNFCEITILMWNTAGTGWYDNSGIEITVDGVSYGTVKLPHAFETYEGEETVLIPSGEVLFSWKGQFTTNHYGFEIYNTLGDLIYTSPAHLPAGVFFTYQNECPHIANDFCNFKFALFSTAGVGWAINAGIEITVDGIGYVFVNLPFGVGNDYAEEIIPLPSGEIQLFWIGNFAPIYHFDIYNSSDELIYTSPDYLPVGLFSTYQNECPECLPLTDFEGVYIQEEKQVNLTWEAPETTDLTGFNIFRNDSLIGHVFSTTLSYSDNTSELENGDYKYCVVPVYPFVCTLDDKCFETYISNVGVKNYKDNITIYPNPANNVVNITGADIANVTVFNNIGQLILTQDNTNTINVSELTNGIYIFSVELLTGYTTQKKIIINH
jgi:hypothetical protein